jgi:hypothetical protein
MTGSQVYFTFDRCPLSSAPLARAQVKRIPLAERDRVDVPSQDTLQSVLYCPPLA